MPHVAPLVTIHRTMDDHSRDIRREGCSIGFLQFHEDSGLPPHVELHAAGQWLTIGDMQKLLREFENCKTSHLPGMSPEEQQSE